MVYISLLMWLLFRVRVKGSIENYMSWVLFDLTLLTAEERELLAKAASLMEELLETLEVMQDEELVKDLRVALREVEEGKTRPFNELLRELDLEEEI